MYKKLDSFIITDKASFKEIIRRLYQWFDKHGFDLSHPETKSPLGFNLRDIPTRMACTSASCQPEFFAEHWPFAEAHVHFQKLLPQIKVLMTEVILPNMSSRFKAIDHFMSVAHAAGSNLVDKTNPAWSEFIESATYIFELIRKEAELHIAIADGAAAMSFLGEREAFVVGEGTIEFGPTINGHGCGPEIAF